MYLTFTRQDIEPYFIILGFYWGCMFREKWPGVDFSFNGCRDDYVRGWDRSPITWCFCDHTDFCNVNIESLRNPPNPPPRRTFPVTTRPPRRTTRRFTTTARPRFTTPDDQDNRIPTVPGYYQHFLYYQTMIFEKYIFERIPAITISNIQNCYTHYYNML